MNWVDEWLIQREEEAIRRHGWYSVRAEFWTLCLDGRGWVYDRVSPRAWVQHVITGTPPTSWAQRRKAGNVRFSKIS